MVPSQKPALRRYLSLVLVGLFFACLSAPLHAQSNMLLSLDTASTNLTTGQTYDVTIRLDDAAEVWLADLQINYDPALVYVMGTKSGSPVSPGTLFDPGSSQPLKDEVLPNAMVHYLVSMFAPANPVSGSGIIGTFRIYPLAPGKTELTIPYADLEKAIFEDQNGQRVGVGSQRLTNLTVAKLELTITGDKVAPPSEATATPLPTETPMPAPTNEQSTVEPTLVNVTLAPRTPTPATVEPPPAETGSTSPLLIVAIVVMVIGGVGTVVVVISGLRRRK